MDVARIREGTNNSGFETATSGIVATRLTSREIWGSAAATIIPERLLPLCGPECARMVTVPALELACHPKQRAKDDGAIVAGELE